MHKSLRRMMEQPLSLLADDNECTMLSFDNGVSQQQIEELVLEDEDMQEIAEEVKDLIVNHFPQYRKYFNSEPKLVELVEYKYDEYPEPIRGVSNNKGITVLVCLARYWSKHWGGDVLGYHRTEPVEVVSSYPGRIIVSEGDNWVKVSQPNVSAETQLHYLQFKLAI